MNRVPDEQTNLIFGAEKHTHWVPNYELADLVMFKMQEDYMLNK